MKNQSDKKIRSKFTISCKSVDYLLAFVNEFKLQFRVAQHSQTQNAYLYLKGLLMAEKGKGNMERMAEEVPESEYRAYQHFISKSNWDYNGVLDKVAQKISELLKANKSESKRPTGLIIDESAHCKKGKKSVGVSRQHAGVVGKVDNCQVGVYLSLVNDNRAGLIDERLFIPKNWIKDEPRCKQAGIPKSAMDFKTKPELALEMIDQKLKQGIEFDWIGGDGLYGHSTKLREGIDERGLFYVLDVHKDEKIFTSLPELIIPKRTKKRGRPATKPQPNNAPTRLDKYVEQLTDDDWDVENKVRKTQKGWKKVRVHTKTIWVAKQGTQKFSEQTLIISQSVDGRKDTKFSFSNGKITDYTPKEYAYFQAQRYWVERTFDDAKNELGMSDYQVQKWLGWHHHHSLVFMAGLFLLGKKIENHEDVPIMSMTDARILVIVGLFGTSEDMDKRLEQMKSRHKSRQGDIDRYYKQNIET